MHWSETRGLPSHCVALIGKICSENGNLLMEFLLTSLASTFSYLQLPRFLME